MIRRFFRTTDKVGVVPLKMTHHRITHDVIGHDVTDWSDIANERARVKLYGGVSFMVIVPFNENPGAIL